MEENKNRIISLCATTVVAGLLLFCLFFLGLKKQVPPPAEYGVEVNLGDSDDGMGDIQPNTLSQEAGSTIPPAGNDNYLSNHDDESVYLPSNRNKPQTQVKPETKPAEPQINPSALYPGARNNQQGSTQGGNEGITGKPGDQGQPDGSPSGTSYTGGQGKGGLSFTLQGRTAKNLPKPSYNSQEQGKVVVKIWVDKNGNVVKAQAGEKGTTTTDNMLWKVSEQAALRSSFSPKPDAPDMQVGTITYHFVQLN